jgi:hypothetical protein
VVAAHRFKENPFFCCVVTFYDPGESAEQIAFYTHYLPPPHIPAGSSLAPAAAPCCCNLCPKCFAVACGVPAVVQDTAGRGYGSPASGVVELLCGQHIVLIIGNDSKKKISFLKCDN